MSTSLSFLLSFWSFFFLSPGACGGGVELVELGLEEFAAVELAIIEGVVVVRGPDISQKENLRLAQVF